MTIRDLFQQSSINPAWLLYYFISIPIICLILMLLFRNPNNALRINWLLAIICFLVTIPGIFAITYNIYTFLFERHSILDLNLLIQVLPIFSMAISLYLIKRILPFNYIPGFEKLTSISILIFGIIAIMWIFDRTQIFAFSMIPFTYIIIGFLALVLFMRYGFKRLF